MILTKKEDGSYVETGDNNLFTNMVDGLKAPLLKDNEFLSSKAAFWGTVFYTTGSAIGSSMIARKRQAAGSAPILKVLF